MADMLTRERRESIREEPGPTYRTTAILVGVLFIIGTAAGVASVVVSDSIISSSNFLAEAAAGETSLITGALLVLVMGFPLAMVPVVMYPLFRRYSEALAQGAVVFRGVLEAVGYILLAVAMFALASVGKEFAAAGSPADSHFEVWGSVLIESMAWAEIIVAITFGIGSIMLSWLFLRTELIPRWLAMWGFVGSMLYLVAPFIVVYDIGGLELSLTTSIGFLLAPLAIQEMVFGVWVLVKGFQQHAVSRLVARPS